MLKKIIVLFVSLLIFAGCAATTAATQADKSVPSVSESVSTETETAGAETSEPEIYIPETLYLNPGSTTADINLSWYADVKSDSVTLVRFFDKNGTVVSEVRGTVGPASKGKEAHKVSVTALKPDTQYAYSVSSDGINWSREYAYKTPRAGNFRFAFVGDPQLTQGKQDANNRYFSADKTTANAWKEVVEKIAKENVDFIASAGDQVDDTSDGREGQYTRFFAPEELRSIPFAVTIGNHDRHYLSLYHYNMPNEQKFEPLFNNNNAKDVQKATVEAAGNYWYLYNNALFVVLNSAAYPGSVDVAKLYIERYEQTLSRATAINRGKYTWLFVQHHKSTVACYEWVDGIGYAEAGFDKLMDKYNVDFVLGGHDHVYARTLALRGGRIVNSSRDTIVNPGGTISLTVNTSGGLKYNPVPENFPETIAMAVQFFVPQYTIVDVSGDTVSFTTHAIDDAAPIDSFKVIKRRAR